jgi:hypothetical protein
VSKTGSLLIGLIFALVVACGGDDERPPDGAPPARAILTASSDAAERLDTFHFRLTHENGTTPLPMNLRLKTAEGEVVTPASVAGTVRAEALGGIDVSVDIVAIENNTWITNPFTRSWQRLSGTDLRDFADPANLMASLLPALQDATVAGETSIDGVRVWRLTGTMDSREIARALPFAEPGHRLNVEIWIGVEDSLPRRARLAGPLATGEAAGVVRQLDLSRFNESFTIQPPR